MRMAVAIVGGGPAASAAALSLARRGIASMIIERGDDVDRLIDGGDLRLVRR